jgi:hypothetical protein
MSFTARYLKGDVKLWQSFWLVTLPLFVLLISDTIGNFLMPYSIRDYSVNSAVIRLLAMLIVLVLCLLTIVGTWKSSSKYEGNALIRLSTKLTCIAYALTLSYTMLFVFYGIYYKIEGLDPYYFFT